MRKSVRYIYLDCAASTPLDPKVERAMAPFWRKNFENPSALYGGSVRARRAIDDARKRVAVILNATSTEITFVPGGTAGNNLAIMGIARAAGNGHIIISAIEHESVLEPVRQLEREGFGVTYIKPDRDGVIPIESLKKSLRPDTILVSVMYANNEVGTIQPIREITKMIRDHRRRSPVAGHRLPYFHTDACQAANYLDLNVQKLGVDLMTINGSKIYGPKMSGCLYVRNGISIRPIVTGGGQEKSLWSGTENVSGIVGFATALAITEQKKEKEKARLTALRDYFIEKLLTEIPGTALNGHAIDRLPNNIHISIHNIDGEAAVLYLDAAGIACAIGSACTSHSVTPSHVLRAMGFSEKRSKSSLRLTMGRGTTKKDCGRVIQELTRIIPLIRNS